MKLIDTDMHLVEPPDLYREAGFVPCLPFGIRAGAFRMPELPGTRLIDDIGGSDDAGPLLHEYLDFMDAHNIGHGVLFPTNGLYLLSVPHIELAMACDAWRSYASKWCDLAEARVDAGRPFSYVAMLPLADPEEAHDQIIQAAADPNCVGMVVKPGPVRGRTLFHSAFADVYRLLHASSLPVAVHDVAGGISESFGSRSDTAVKAHAMCHVAEAMQFMMDLAFHPAQERTPIHAAFFECGAGWVPSWIERLDEHWSSILNLDKNGHKPPYHFSQSMAVAMEYHGFKLLRDEKMKYNLLWSSDFPHYDYEAIAVNSEESYRLNRNAERVFPRLLARAASRL